MTGFAVPLGVIALCVLVEGFFSGSEIAIVSCRWARIRREAEQGDRRAALLLKLWNNPDRLLATTLVGTNISVIIASVMAVYLAVNFVGAGSNWFAYLAGKEEILVILFLSPVTLFFGEIVPKSFYQSMANKMAKNVAYPIAVAWFVFFPVTMVMTFFSGLVGRIVRSKVEASPFVSREELSLIVKLRDLKTELKKHERRMIKRLFSFRETKVRETMVPLVRVKAHEEGVNLGRALRTFSRFKYSRYPVFRKKMFNVVGILNILSCIEETNFKKKVGRLMDPPYFVPENKSVVDLLREMERDNVRMAVAVDEYGGAVGIITLEDILEEIVGELEDEHEINKSGFRRLDETNYEIDAHMDIEHVSENLGINIPGGDYETLAGLMADKLGRIPRRGEKVMVKNLTLTALNVKDRTVERVLVSIARGQGGSESEKS